MTEKKRSFAFKATTPSSWIAAAVPFVRLIWIIVFLRRVPRRCLLEPRSVWSISCWRAAIGQPARQTRGRMLVYVPSISAELWIPSHLYRRISSSIWLKGSRIARLESSVFQSQKIAEGSTRFCDSQSRTLISDAKQYWHFINEQTHFWIIFWSLVTTFDFLILFQLKIDLSFIWKHFFFFK